MATVKHPSSESLDFEQDQELSLSDRLKPFKSSQFDPQNYLTSKCHGMSEKEIRHCCAYLKDLKKASAEEMRKSVYANYSAFIRTAKEISALEGQLLSMRNLLSAQAKVIHDLSEGVRIETLYHDAEDPTNQDISDEETTELAKIDNWLAGFHETMDVLLAEKRVDEALSALDEAERVSEEINGRRVLSPSALISFAACISEQRQKLSDQLKEAASQPSTRGGELRSAVLALKKLGDGFTAHSLLLNAHHQKIQISMKSLRPNGGNSSISPSSDTYCSSSPNKGGVSYSASLSQLVFSTIGQAATDSLAVFGEDTSFTSELVTWAVEETEAFASLIIRHSLASAASAGNLRSATLTAHVCMGHCLLLEARGLALSSILLKNFKPCVEQALSANLLRIERTCAALAADDDWSLNFPTTTTTSSVSQTRLSSSGYRFSSMILEMLEDAETLETMQLVSPTLDGLLHVFQSYVGIMINALPGSMNEGNQEASSVIVKQAESLTQQMSLLANAVLLGDELIPRAASKVLPLAGRGDETARRGGGGISRFPEQREWKRRLQRTVDFLRDSFCRQHALELIFTEDGYIRLNATMYLCVDDIAQEPDWFPSPIFQELFAKLTQIATIASDMFVGKERFATVLLMRLTETVILWLSEDQTFWEDIEQGPKSLGAFGLQQFYLDMEFVILFASQGRYLSRKLQEVAKNVIGRAIEAVAATGIDPYSSLPEDEWFADVAQIAIKVLLGKTSFGNLEGDGSPTASVSAISHGSN